jgi:hypothetical protein
MVYGLEGEMATAWEESWTEIWADGYGRNRSYCGIAGTEDGFAVDVFRGDTCLASATYGTWQEAEREAEALRARYVVGSIGYTSRMVNPTGCVSVPGS